MAEPRRMDRLSGQDLMALWFDELGWPEDIGAIAILDGSRLLDHHGRVRIQAIRRHLEPRLQLVPRFRQRLYRPPWGWADPCGWTRQPSTSLTTFGSTRSPCPATRSNC
jgi:hypothetical protein